MRIAFSAEGATPESMLDPRFGRAKRFMVYDEETASWTAVDNAQNLQAAQGAGIQAAGTVAESGAKALVTGHAGPKAFAVLEKAEIEVYLSGPRTVGEALAAFQRGELQRASGADVEGHW